jgi:hypothetical protein
MKSVLCFGGLAAALLLAGCQGAPVVRPATYESYTPQYAAAMHQLELIGTAAGPGGTEQLAAVAAKGIAQGSMAGPQFTLYPRKEEDPQYSNRVVVVIGGADGGSLCAAPPQTGSELRAPGPLRVAAAACTGGSRLSSTSGSVSEITGPDDPAVARLFRQIGAELFPMRNPNYDPEDHGFGWDF